MGDFEKRNFVTQNECFASWYGHLADIDLDGVLDWVCPNATILPGFVYNYTTLPFVDVSFLLPTTFDTADSTFADFVALPGFPALVACDFCIHVEST